MSRPSFYIWPPPNHTNMKLEKILASLNSFEKNAFLKIIDGILLDKPKNSEAIGSILSTDNRDLKNVDNINVSKVFSLLEDEFIEFIQDEISCSTSQFDILIDIISKDGNSIMKQDWFARLYENKISKFMARIDAFKHSMDSQSAQSNMPRIRDYKIYMECMRTAYENDRLNNQDFKITSDEQSILSTLSKELGLTREEVKLIKYQVIPLKRSGIDDIINDLRNIGVILFSKKNNTVYVADEMARLLRIVRGKEVADKHFRRVLRVMREPQLNQVCKRYQLDWRLPTEDKIAAIIEEGASFRSVLISDMHREGISLTDRKKEINNLCDKGLNIQPAIRGVLIEEKVDNLVKHFEEVERDERVGISVDGYDKLLRELHEAFPVILESVRGVFELQEVDVMKTSFLLDYNIKPRDVLDLLPDESLRKYCEMKGIKVKGNVVENILDSYKDTKNLYIENYESIGLRDLNTLKANGIALKESELGARFEFITKELFTSLGFNVDEAVRKELNTKKDLIDVVINLGDSNLMIVECKTIKEKGYDKFSAVSRQLKSYVELAESRGFRVIKALLVAPLFSDDFVKDCGLEYQLNLSLIEAATLKNVVAGFKQTKLKVLPYNLLLRDVVIQEERILKAIGL